MNNEITNEIGYGVIKNHNEHKKILSGSNIVRHYVVSDEYKYGTGKNVKYFISNTHNVNNVK